MEPIWWLKFGQFGGRIWTNLAAEFWPICWTNLAAEFWPICWTNLGQFGSWSSKFFISFLTTFGLIFDRIIGLIFGLSKQTKFRASLPERKCTGNSGPLFLGFGSDFRENTPDFENVTGMHCLTMEGRISLNWWRHWWTTPCRNKSLKTHKLFTLSFSLSLFWEWVSEKWTDQKA